MGHFVLKSVGWGEEPSQRKNLCSMSVKTLHSYRVQNPLVRSLCIADDTRILPGDEGHSDSDFFLIFLDDRLQEGEKLFLLFEIALSFIYVAAELPHEFDVVHVMPSPATGDFTIGGSGSEIRESLYGERSPRVGFSEGS